MKSAEKHKSSRQHNKSNQPFFNKQGQNSFFSAENETDLQTKSFFSSNIQTKLSVGSPDDPYEKEADRLADKVIQTPKSTQPAVQQKPKRDYSEGFVDDEDQMAQSPIQLKEVQAKQENPSAIDSSNISRIGKGIFRKILGLSPKAQPIQQKETPDPENQEVETSQEPTLQKQERTYGLPQPGLETRLNKSKGGGVPMPEETKGEMEQSFGADFGEVKIHTDTEAEGMNQELGAQAFTHGADIYFNKGKYQPESIEGKRLLAHELTHTIQQDAVARMKPDLQKEDEPTKEEMLRDLKTSNEEQRDAFDPSEAQATRKEADVEGLKAEQLASVEIPEVHPAEPKPLPKEEESTGTRIAEPTPKKPDKVVPSSKSSPATQSEPSSKQGEESAEKAEALADTASKEVATDTPGGGEEGSSGTGSEGAGSEGEGGKGPIGQKLEEESAEVCNKGAEKAQKLADNESAHDTASEKAAQTDVAVVPPAEEGQSRANQEQVNTLDKAEAPEPNAEETKREMNEAISKAVPTKIKELNKFESEKRAQVIGNKVLADTQKQVGEVQGTYNEIEQAPPAAESETPVALPQVEQAPATSSLNLGKDAVPELQAEDTDLSEYENQAENIYEKEGITPDMKQEMEKVDSGDIAEANKEKGVLKKKVAEEPAKMQSFAQEQKKGVEKDLDKEEAKGKASMKAKRKKELEGAKGKQEKTKTDMEKKREAVTKWINERYEKAKTTVTDKLGKLEKQALKRFDAGQKRLSKAFERNVKYRVNRWKDKRYSGFWGGAKWLKDKFVGIDHFQEIKDIFSSERATFVRGVDDLIIAINKSNDEAIQSCKDELALAKKEIAKYVEELEPALKGVGEKAQKETDKKLAELDEHIEKEKKKLQQKLCDAKEAAIKAIDDKIEKMKSEMSGLVGKLGALLLYAAKKFFKWVIGKIGGSADKIMKIINKGATVLKKIFTDPIGFFKNLGKAVGGGINRFVGNIVSWLKKGLVGWLMGAMGDSGLELPEKFNLKGILFLGLQVAGLTWNVIRARLVKKIGPKGEKVVGAAEKGMSIIQRVRKEGPIALWNIIVEKAGEIKEKVMGGIRDWAITKIVKSATVKLVSMLNPAGAIFQAIMLLYKTVMFFVENWQRIVDFVSSIFDSIGSIAKGAIGAAAGFIEQTLGKTIPIMLSFLAKFIGLDGIGKAIKNVIKAIQKPFKKILDKIIGFLVKKVKKLFGKLMGKGKKGKEKTTAGDKAKAIKELKAEDKRIAKDGKMNEKEAKEAAKKAKGKNKAFKSITVKKKGSAWQYDTIFRAVDGSLVEGEGNGILSVKKKADPSVLKEIEKIYNKNKDKFDGLNEAQTIALLEKEGIFIKIKEKPLAKNDHDFGKNAFKGQAIPSLKKAMKASDKTKEDLEKSEEDYISDRLSIIHGEQTHTAGNAKKKLGEQVFNQSGKSNANFALEEYFTFSLNSDTEHTQFEPEIYDTQKDTPKEGFTTIFYTYKGGNAKFKVVFDDKDLTHEIQAEELSFNKIGRGRLQGGTKVGLDRSHLIADMISGSGYRKSRNIVYASSQFNRITMKAAEQTLAARINNYGDVESFNIQINVQWANSENDIEIAQVKTAINRRLKAIGSRTGEKLDIEKDLLNDLAKMSSNTLEEKIEKNLSDKSQPRIMNVVYTLKKVVLKDGNTYSPLPIIGQLIATGPDEFYGTK